jgi:hypothetical protein
MLDFYTELQETIEALRQVEDHQTPWGQKLTIMVRHFLLQCCDNKLMFYSLYDSNGILLNDGGINKVPISTLLHACLVSQIENICFFMMFLNFA